jgi:hypothetical protein
MSELGHIVGRPFKLGQSGNPSGLACTRFG